MKAQISHPIFATLILAILGLAAIVWALSKTSGLAWFPGFILAVFCFIKILDVNGVGDKA